jgi:hypothetical protein
MVAVKQIGLEGLKEEEISQLMREVDLVKRLSHPSIVKYEGMARDANTLSIVLECVSPFLCCAVLPLAATHLVILRTLTPWQSPRVGMPRTDHLGKLSKRSES